FRPFPEDLLRKFLSGRERIAIMDRDVCPGLGGILWGEVRGVVPDALVQGYMVGVGGGDVQPKHIQEVLDDLISLKSAGTPKIMEVA
nr:pyruvate ferredoxin oxidoreductase [Planctomycetota bacterium]